MNEDVTIITRSGDLEIIMNRNHALGLCKDVKDSKIREMEYEGRFRDTGREMRFLIDLDSIDVIIRSERIEE